MMLGTGNLRSTRRAMTLVAVLAATLAPEARAGFTPFSANGADAAAIQSTVDSFRAAVGTLNPNVAGSFGSGRREINWDGVPNTFADPNLLPGNFFNANSPRGVVLSTPGTGFLVSASTGNPTGTPTVFGFPGDLTTFSPQRLFAPVNSVITDVNFFIPGTNTAATVGAFGAVFTDVEVANLSKIEFFDASNTLIFSRFVEAGPNAGLSFLGGVANAGEQIGRVRITSGDIALIANGQVGPGTDTVVLDDFIFAEPVPEPTGLALLGLGLAIGLGVRRNRRA